MKFKTDTGILQKIEHLYDEYCEWYLTPEVCSERSLNTRQKWQHLVHKHPDGPNVVSMIRLME